MASANTLCKALLNVKHAVIDKKATRICQTADGITCLHIAARPDSRHQNRCPVCGRKCPGYDRKGTKVWRGLDMGAVFVEVEAPVIRVNCPEHGILTASVPWAYTGSRFTKDFDMTVAWLAVYLPRSTVSEFMRIDWETVGRCVTRALKDIEPDRSRRLDGLVNIGIDETSYRKGYKYITVVVNHDTNTVVWAHQGYGKSVLEEFFETLSPEQRSSIRVVTGDGARWITDCVNKYIPRCRRCVDPFHVVEWAMDALDTVRREAWRTAREKALKLEKETPRKRGRPKTDDKAAAAVLKAKAAADTIKGSAYTLGKAPGNLTDAQELRLEAISVSDPKLYRAYLRKEELRILLKNTDPDTAQEELRKWYWKASHSRIPAIVELGKKVMRHKEHILNTIRFKMSNARIEATNNKIKLIIRKAYGFRNIDNMLSMVYLVCSSLKVPLPNRNQHSKR